MKSSLVLCVVSAALAFPARTTCAQDRVSGFADFRWGATRAAILARLGKPTEDLVDSTYERLNYVQGADSGYLLVLARQSGLVAAIRILPLDVGAECGTIVRADRDRIGQVLRSLTPLETTTRASSGDSCGGFKDWDVVWRDRDGNRILLSVDVMKHRLYISYSSHLAPG